MPTKTEPLLLRVKDPEELERNIVQLEEVVRELSAFNPRNTQFPLKGVVKDRWVEGIQESVNYFKRFLPKERNHADDEDSSQSE